MIISKEIKRSNQYIYIEFMIKKNKKILLFDNK